MEFLRNIRIKTGRSLLLRKTSGTRRKIFYSSFDNVKNIGLVWDASVTEDFPVLSRFHQKMEERGIDVTIIGYFPGKTLPDQYTAIRYLNCFKRENLNFFYQPQTKEAVSFISRRFDVLIDINFNKLFPLQYISSLSGSALKAGLKDSDPEKSPFDLMIEMKKPFNTEAYLDQVICYLEMIKAGDGKAA